MSFEKGNYFVVSGALSSDKKVNATTVWNVSDMAKIIVAVLMIDNHIHIPNTHECRDISTSRMRQVIDEATQYVAPYIDQVSLIDGLPYFAHNASQWMAIALAIAK